MTHFRPISRQFRKNNLIKLKFSKKFKFKNSGTLLLFFLQLKKKLNNLLAGKLIDTKI